MTPSDDARLEELLDTAREALQEGRRKLALAMSGRLVADDAHDASNEMLAAIEAIDAFDVASLRAPAAGSGEALEALMEMVSQFAAQHDDGTVSAGGFSALETAIGVLADHGCIRPAKRKGRWRFNVAAAALRTAAEPREPDAIPGDERCSIVSHNPKRLTCFWCKRPWSEHGINGITAYCPPHIFAATYEPAAPQTGANHGDD